MPYAAAVLELPPVPRIEFARGERQPAADGPLRAGVELDHAFIELVDANRQQGTPGDSERRGDELVIVPIRRREHVAAVELDAERARCHARLELGGVR